MTTASVVVLTMGDRPDDLARALASVDAQTAPGIETIVVGNGCDPEVPGARVIASGENIGVAAGRNLGWAAAAGDVVFFLDDDARYEGTDVVTEAMRRFDDAPDLAVISFRIVDEDGTVISKHMPTLWKGNPTRVTDVTTFLGGACAVRRSLLDTVGGFPDEFFYALEETDLAWRSLDAGLRIQYAGDLVVAHPSIPLSERAGAIRHTARNRVLLARRRLPVPLAVVYLAVRGLMSLGIVRSLGDLKSLFGGYRAGMLDDAGERAPIRWRTAWRMLRLGRPPVI